MAIDSRNKRASIIGFDGPYRMVWPDPDNDIDTAADRAHMGYKYAGITPTGVVAQVLHRMLIGLGL